MKRAPIYSRAARKHRERAPGISTPEQAAPVAMASMTQQASQAPGPKRFARRGRAFLAKHERVLLVMSSVIVSALLFLAYTLSQAPERRFTQRDIDAAVLHTLETKTLPSPEAKAFEKIRRSVVRIVQEEDAGKGAPGKNVRGVGTGVVIVDKGIILTCLHVVEGEDGEEGKSEGPGKIKVQFANGLESEAVILQRQPEHDLAVIRAKNIPDDLMPATLRSTQGLAVGEKVEAVGFPFNIGPSASSGIISGLNRNYHSPDGKEVLRNLIQFDAAANPGNSGGPLVTMDGEVVGIVTAILSPHEQGTFIGIAFAVPIEVAAAAAGEPPF